MLFVEGLLTLALAGMGGEWDPLSFFYASLTISWIVLKFSTYSLCGILCATFGGKKLTGSC